MKKYIKHTFTLLIIILLIVSCGKKETTSIVDNTPQIKVAISKVSMNNSSPFLSVNGKIQASKSATLSTRMMGYVSQVHVKVGQNVKKGELLISINNEDLKAKQAQVNAEIVKAKTAFANAEKNYKRFKNLFESNSITQKEMDDIAVHFQMAKSSLEVAKQMKKEINAQFEYSNIKAPFSGVITSKNIESGAMANPGMPLLSMEIPNNFEVIAMVPESEIIQIKDGDKVNVIVNAIHKTIPGIVTEISTSAKNTGGQYLVKINVTQKSTSILSGMFATVQFPLEKNTKNTMVLIPNKALVKKGQLSGVYTVSEMNTAVLRWLRIGRTYGDKVEILSGLNASESYIISAEGKLYNGAKITIQ